MIEQWTDERMAKIFILAAGIEEHEALVFVGLEGTSTMVVCARGISAEGHTEIVSTDIDAFGSWSKDVNRWRWFPSTLLDTVSIEKINNGEFNDLALRGCI